MEQKILLAMLHDEILEDESSSAPDDLLASLSVTRWPHRYDKPVVHVDSLPKGGADYVAQNADSSTMEKVTRLNLEAFNLIHKRFEMQWRRSMFNNGLHEGRLVARAITSKGCLLLLLHWIAHGPSLTTLTMFSGMSMSSVSRYLNLGLDILFSVLKEIPEASLDCPSSEYLGWVGDKAGETYGSVMKGCCIVTDGSLHALEKDYMAQDNFFYDEYHPDYNGWKGCYCKKGLYFFCLDGTIIWYCIDCPGSWADGAIFD